MKAQVGAVIPIILTVIAGIVGLAVLDSLAVSTIAGASVQNETQTLPEQITAYLNSPVGIQYTLGKDGSYDSGLVITTNNSVPLVLTTNYTLNTVTGVVNITSFANQSAYSKSLLNTYNYKPTTQYTSTISRTVVSYFVPLGLLGVLGFMAYAYIKREE